MKSVRSSLAKPEPASIDHEGEDKTHVNFKASGMQVSVIGTATAVIAIVAVIGLILVSMKLVDLAQRSIDHVPSDRNSPRSTAGSTNEGDHDHYQARPLEKRDNQ